MLEHVSFKNNNLKIAGNLYFPENFDRNKKYPAIVTVHPGGGVKEQVAGHYSKILSESGYITLAFDATYQGESEGEPRYLENPTARVEDVRAAVDFLTTLPYVDKDRIGGLGICAGGGYVLSATKSEHRIKAVATVSAVDIGGMYVKGWDGITPICNAVQMLEAVGQQRNAEANGNDSLYIPWVPENPAEITIPEFVDAYEYYRTPRAQHPNSPNKLLFTSLDKVFAFSAFERIESLLTQPVLLIAGSNAGSLWFSKDAYDRITGKKELFIVEGANHMDMYDKPEYVSQAVAKMKDFYGKNL